MKIAAFHGFYKLPSLINNAPTGMAVSKRNDYPFGQLSNPSSSSLQRQRGMTLIEILISLLLGVFLIGGIMQVFITSKQTYHTEEALARLQENGRFALDALAREIRKTDYRANGCDGFVYVAPNMPLRGYDNDPTAPANPSGDVLDGTDSIQLRWVTGSPPGTPCTVTGNSPFRVNADNNLFLNTTEVVEGVQDMQILYGVDTAIAPPGNLNGDGIADYYAPGTLANFPDTTAWQRVVSVRVYVLLMSEDNVASKPTQYFFMGMPYSPNDRRIRREFNTTIALRNRLR